MRVSMGTSREENNRSHSRGVKTRRFEPTNPHIARAESVNNQLLCQLGFEEGPQGENYSLGAPVYRESSEVRWGRRLGGRA